MDPEPIKVLLVEDNPGDALLLQMELARVPSTSFRFVHVERLAVALQKLQSEPFDVVLLDLSLPDSNGLDTFREMHGRAPAVPVVVMSGLDDEMVAIHAVQAGAQDYLVKGQVEGRTVVRSLRHAIERQRGEEMLKQTAVELAVSNQELRRLAADLETSVTSERRAHQELQKVHRTLQETQSQLVQQEKLAALGQLVAGVAHEINNPLAFVVNNLAVLQRDLASVCDLLRLYQQGNATLAAHQPELYGRVHDQAEAMDLPYTLDNVRGLMLRSCDGLSRIQQLVRNLRDFGRLSEHELREVDLNAGIQTTLMLLAHTAEKHGVDLRAELGPIPLVNCYASQINQVVLNLVANAIDACASGGLVRVRTCCSAGEVEIHVIDNGCGIAPAIRDKIFDPFFTTKPPGKGTGLGLSICHSIVTDHGGHIEVETELGVGAHFIVSLPVRLCSSNDRPVLQTSGTNHVKV